MLASKALVFSLVGLSVGALCARGQEVITPMARIVAADSTSSPRLGDTVTVAGRVSLDYRVIDTGRVILYLEGPQVGLRVYRRARFGRLAAHAGDSLRVTGRLVRYHGEIEIEASRLYVVPASPRLPSVAMLSSLLPAVLDAHTARLVSVSGVIVASISGRGDHVLQLTTPPNGLRTATVDLTESDDGAANLAFDRFEPGDSVTATGLLVSRPTLDGPTRYLIYPRSATDIHPLGWTARSRRRAAATVVAALAIAMLVAIGVSVRRRLRVERERSDAIVRESAARYRRLVDEAPMGIVVTHDGTILFANASFGLILGVERVESLHGTHIADLLHTSDSAVVHEQLARTSVLRASETLNFSQRVRRLDGEAANLSFVSAAITFEGLPAIQTVVQDVTAQSALEAQLLQSQKMEAVGQLAAGVAHDFNNLLTVILASAEMTLTTLPTASEVFGDVSAIKEAADRAAALTRQLLAFSRGQALHPQQMDVSIAVRNVAQMLRRVIGADISLEMSLVADTWLVAVDPGQLDQVLMNLAVNARDAMPQGGVLKFSTANAEVLAGAAECQALTPGQYATITVEDDGSGMEAPVLRHLFEPFFTTKEPGKGTGLGLATAYGIVKQSGGSIQVSSIVGEGSRFTIFLPRDDAFKSDELSAASLATSVEVGTILLIEDEAGVRKVAQRMLEQQGHRVLTAISGTDGLRSLSEADASGMRIDLVISDVVMPEMGGRVFGQYLALYWPTLPMLYISGYSDDAHFAHESTTGDIELLHKPFTTESLSAAVQRALAVLERPSGSRYPEHEGFQPYTMHDAPGRFGLGAAHG